MGAVMGVSVVINVVLLFALIVRREARIWSEGMAEGDGPPRTRRPKFRRFIVVRDEDVSSVSGTGVICEGVEFSDTHAAIHWLGKYPMTTPHHQGIKTVEAIHGHGGKTRLVWLDEA